MTTAIISTLIIVAISSIIAAFTDAPLWALCLAATIGYGIGMIATGRRLVQEITGGRR
jgi:hypothetical protein